MAGDQVQGARGQVVAATASPWATQAALDVLRRGGSAADAVVTAQAVLTFAEPNASGLGGGALIVWHDAASRTSGVLDGLSAAPARVTAALQEDFDGRTIPAERAVIGGRSVGVPGAVRALDDIHARFGRLAWASLLEPAIVLAEQGIPMPPNLARTLGEVPGMKDEPMTQALFFAEGRPLPVGAPIRNPGLARTLRILADEGAGAFYEGALVAEMVAAVQADVLPGTLTAADFAAYRAIERLPLRLPMGEDTVLTAPPPAFGGLVAGQIVGMMSARGLLGADFAVNEAAVHVLCEAGRLGYADRGAYVGDPAFVDDPAQALLDPDYLAHRAALIGEDRVLRRVGPGRVAGYAPAAPGGGLGGTLTSHMVVADAAGLVVSMTTTVNQQFGSRLSACGFYLNNVQTNFAKVPEMGGVPSRNVMAPGKRPMTSFAPTLVIGRDGQVRAGIGGSGGNRIPGFVANGLLRIAAGGRDAAAVVAAPHALRTGMVTDVEPALREHVAALSQRGHWVMLRRLDAAAQAAVRDGAAWTAGADPRRGGAAGGF